MKSSNRVKVNIDDIITKLKQQPYCQKTFVLNESQIQALCMISRSIITNQPILLELNAPVQICGDTHGQFNDLLNIFKLYGEPQKKNYLFLGDYVDRGKQSLQCICLLMAYKIKHPENFFFLRGNHQSSELNKLYGFYDQCKRRTSIKVWKMISNTFSFYPLAAVVSNRIFCVHGGLSPHLKNLSALNNIKRPVDPTGNSIISDMLWADPKSTIDGWCDNEQRGISYYYGKNVIDLFISRNDFDLICRSHQVVQEGYEFMYDKKLITIFSAPNYCGQFNNLGAILDIAQDLTCKLQQFQGQVISSKRNRIRSVTPVAVKVASLKQDSLKSIQNNSPQKCKQQKKTKRQSIRQQKQSNRKRRPTKFAQSRFSPSGTQQPSVFLEQINKALQQ